MPVTTVAVAMVCKTPAPGQSKTRLTPPLTPQEAAALSACFIRDTAATVASLGAGVTPYAVFTPAGSEAVLTPLLPPTFRLLLQGGGDLGARLTRAAADLFAAGHAGVVLIGSDSPTLPRSILAQAVELVRGGADVVLGGALDGGYTLIGLPRERPELFTRIPWSTDSVHAATLERARESGLTVTNVPRWYDVDDEDSLRLLCAELGGSPPPCASNETRGGDAPATRAWLDTLARTIP
jgi:rSAM/selenodomain-associated transferase 1